MGLAAEHGFFFKAPGASEWTSRFEAPDEQAAWKQMTLPILETYTEATDGSNIEAKDSALVRPPPSRLVRRSVAVLARVQTRPRLPCKTPWCLLTRCASDHVVRA